MSALNILVTVGSDHHPFDRLISWTDEWAAQHLDAISLRVQYGTAQVPEHGDRHDYLPHPVLVKAIEQADLVVTQGGPMGIVEARSLGLRPIVMPRLKAFGEVVDDHQVDLVRFLGSRGDVWLAENRDELHAHLDRALADPAAVRIEPVDERVLVAETVDRFASLVAALPRRRGIPGLGRRRG